MNRKPDPLANDPVNDQVASIRGVALAAGDPEEVQRQKLAKIILNSMYQFLGLLDVNGMVIEINNAALEGAGITLAEVVGKPFWEARWWALSDDTRERVKTMVEQARRGEFVRCDIEIFGEAHGARTIIVDFSLTPIRDDRGQITFLLPEGRNISEKFAIEAELTRKNVELQTALEKLRELDGFKSKFFSNVSHELRTPLALILGPVDQLLKERSGLSQRDLFRLTTIKRNAQSLLQQVNDLLDLARIDASQMPMAYMHVDVPALVREVAADFEEAASDRDIALYFDGEEELAADLDEAKFKRIVANLLSNAFKFTPTGGRIRCSVEHLPNQRFLLSVQDNGPGVPASLKSRIFDRFSQGQDEQAAAGSGLGLNIVKEFVELHHGSVAVLDAPERGAIFQVEVPLGAPGGAFFRLPGENEGDYVHPFTGLMKALEVPPIPANPNLPRLLVVEDNPDLRQFLYDVLADEYQVALAEDGAAALTAALRDPPDLIVSDLMMPGCDGERFILAVRVNEALAHIPVLVLSARADEALRETLLAELVQDYLTKPFSPQELRARVKNLVMVKRTVDLLQRELNSQASDISELTSELVSSRKSLQEGLLALQKSERRWLSLYDNTAVGIALVTPEGRIIKANPALQRMLGYDEREILTVSLLEITEASDRLQTERNVAGLIEGAIGHYNVQKRYERKDGSYLWANVCGSLIPAMEREGPMIAVIVEDITRRKAAEDLLAATQTDLARVSRYTSMGELVASIAHEVNQPLSAIVTNSQAALRWIEREPPNYDEVMAALKRLNRDAVLAGDVIARIRNFLKKGAIKLEPVKVPVMVDGLLQMLRRLLQENGVVVAVDIAADLPAFAADSVQLQQVLLNLLVNAVDAMRDLPPRQRRIAVEVSSNAELGILFTVRDSGPGVPADKVASVFEAFYSTKSEGLGMGLAISRSIVDNHGGRLWYEAGVPGGAVFKFNIPLRSL